ncbi:MAG: hypothetical protein FWF03_01385 [Defluviitaleaceae bacterium]|nr:hypothetical protein [Defluviitaleaceae bacterium]
MKKKILKLIVLASMLITASISGDVLSNQIFGQGSKVSKNNEKIFLINQTTNYEIQNCNMCESENFLILLIMHEEKLQSRICNENKWGIDILYKQHSIYEMTCSECGNYEKIDKYETVWICHGSYDLLEYIPNSNCDCELDCGKYDFNSRASCPKCFMNTYFLTITHGPWYRIGQEKCNQKPWGVDITEECTATATYKCVLCSYGTSTSYLATQVICYGFY